MQHDSLLQAVHFSWQNNFGVISKQFGGWNWQLVWQINSVRVEYIVHRLLQEVLHIGSIDISISLKAVCKHCGISVSTEHGTKCAVKHFLQFYTS